MSRRTANHPPFSKEMSSSGTLVVKDALDFIMIIILVIEAAEVDVFLLGPDSTSNDEYRKKL